MILGDSGTCQIDMYSSTNQLSINTGPTESRIAANTGPLGFYTTDTNQAIQIYPSAGDGLGPSIYSKSDGTNLYTGINNQTPTQALDVTGNIKASGTILGSNLTNTNTGDETATTIRTKIGAATASNNGYLSSTDWTTFNNKEPAHFIPKLNGNETFRGYLTQNNSATITADNIAAIAANGTATARAVASTNTQTKQVRASYAVSTPAANGLCGLRATQLLWAIGSGFKFHTTFAYTDSAYNAGALQYYGLHSLATGQNISSTISVASLTNIIVIGSDAGDTALSIYHNDATGTATKITLNATDFPANRTAGAASTDIFSIEFYNALGSSEVKYRVVNLTTQVTAQGTLSTDLPLSSQLLTFQLIRTSGTSSNACSMDFTKAGVWSLN